MIINSPHLCTYIEVWAPLYHTKYRKYGEAVALVHRDKVYRSSAVIIINFTRAKHLSGQRFCILREDAMKHEIGTNGAEPDNMYIIPMSHLDGWQSGREISEIARSIKWV